MKMGTFSFWIQTSCSHHVMDEAGVSSEIVVDARHVWSSPLLRCVPVTRCSPHTALLLGLLLFPGWDVRPDHVGDAAHSGRRRAEVQRSYPPSRWAPPQHDQRLSTPNSNITLKGIHYSYGINLHAVTITCNITAAFCIDLFGRLLPDFYRRWKSSQDGFCFQDKLQQLCFVRHQHAHCPPVCLLGVYLVFTCCLLVVYLLFTCCLLGVYLLQDWWFAQIRWISHSTSRIHPTTLSMSKTWTSPFTVSATCLNKSDWQA